MSKVNKPPLSLSRLTKFMKGKVRVSIYFLLDNNVTLIQNVLKSYLASCISSYKCRIENINAFGYLLGSVKVVRNDLCSCIIIWISS